MHELRRRSSLTQPCGSILPSSPKGQGRQGVEWQDGACSKQWTACAKAWGGQQREQKSQSCDKLAHSILRVS